MKCLKKFFGKAERENQQPPVKEYSWEEIIEIMYDKELDFADTAASVVYSRDKSKRYIILKSDEGYYKYRFESIMPFGDEELRYFKFPATWEERHGFGASIFGTYEEALNVIRSEPEYKQYFEQ